jgi:hypothetical protein
MSVLLSVSERRIRRDELRRFAICAGLAVVLITINILVLDSRPVHLVLGWSSLIWPIVGVVVALGLAINQLLRRLMDADRPVSASTDRIIQIAFFVGCALAFQLPAFAAHVGIQSETGLGARLGDVGGVLPFADAKQWYGAAIKMAAQDIIGPVASRRPLNAAITSTMLIFSGMNFKTYLHLMAALSGLATAYFATQIRRMFGTAAALLAVVVLYLLIYDYVPSFLSEHIGYLLGTLAAGFLLAAYRFDNPWLVGIATCVLLFAFAARAGAELIVPALVLMQVYATFVYFKGRRQRLQYAAFGILMLAIGLLTPMVILKVYDTKGGMYQGNVYNLIYDITVDKGAGWKQFQLDYPENNKAAWDEEKYTFLRETTLRVLRENFDEFVVHYFQRLGHQGILLPRVVYGELLKPWQGQVDLEAAKRIGGTWFPPYVVLCLVALFATRLLTIRGRIGFLLILLGLAGSLPIIWVGGSLRMQTATYSLFGFILAAPFALPYRRFVPVGGDPEDREGVPALLGRWRVEHLQPGWAHVLAGLVITALVLSTVFIPHAYNPFLDFSVPHDKLRQARKAGFSYVLFGGHTPFIRYVDQKHALRPNVNGEEIKKSFRYTQGPEFFGNLQPGEQVSLGFVLPGGINRVFVSPTFCIPTKNVVYKAKVIPIKPPYVYRLEQIEPAGFSPIPYGDYGEIECR